MMNTKQTLMMTASALLLAVGTQADAGVINPTGATATSYGDIAIRPATDMIDGSKLSGGGTSGDILSELSESAGSDGHWLSASDAVGSGTTSTTEVLTFDLGGTFDVAAIHFWSYIRSQATRGVRNMDVSFSFDGGINYTTTLDAGTFDDFTVGPTTGTDAVQTRTFASQSGVTHIQFSNIQTHGSTSYIGINEIRFDTVPEPGSLALLGLGGLLIARRRRG